MYFLYNQMGPSVFAGLGVMLLLIPFNFWISIKQRRLQFTQMKLKDNRLKMINEILNGIKVRYCLIDFAVGVVGLAIV